MSRKKCCFFEISCQMCGIVKRCYIDPGVGDVSDSMEATMLMYLDL